MSDKAKGTLFLVVLVALVIRFSSCTHTHEWIDATCTEPRTCSSCKKTEGNPLGHSWSDATCTKPKTCLTCGAAEGRRTDHTWVPATCDTPEHCAVCGKKAHWYSLSLAHDWQPATCTEPKTCSLCGETYGSPNGHYGLSYTWEITVEPTCQSEGERTNTCFNCGAFLTETVPLIDCQPGEWQTITPASASSPGVQVQYCTMCGAELSRKELAYSPPSINKSSSGNKGGGNFNTYDNEEQQNTSASYVLNTSSKIFHYPSCRSVKKISPENYSTSSSSRSDLISLGYDPCGICHP